MERRSGSAAGRVGLAVLALFCAGLPHGPAAGQTAAAAGTPASGVWQVPRTPWGHPDLQGVWTSDEEYGVPLERPVKYGEQALLDATELAKKREDARKRARLEAGPPTLTEAEKADAPPRLLSGTVGDGPEHWFELGQAISARTSLVIDPPNGRIPPFTELANGRVIHPRTVVGYEDGRRGGAADGPEDLNLAERCLTRGLPNLWVPQVYNNGFQIVQSPDYVTVYYERLHEARVIPLDGRAPLASGIRQWIGSSRGHWDGDTLVVDVTNFSDKTSYKRSGEGLHLVERYRRLGPDTVSVEITLDDPTTWTRPWTMAVTGKRDPRYWQIFEYACHEGNYSLSHVLSGARAEESRTGTNGSGER
jgi:hypothetical protein